MTLNRTSWVWYVRPDKDMEYYMGNCKESASVWGTLYSSTQYGTLSFGKPRRWLKLDISASLVLLKLVYLLIFVLQITAHFIKYLLFNVIFDSMLYSMTFAVHAIPLYYAFYLKPCISDLMMLYCAVFSLPLSLSLCLSLSLSLSLSSPLLTLDNILYMYICIILRYIPFCQCILYCIMLHYTIFFILC